MNTLQEMEAALSILTRGIVRTRISVWVLVHARRLGVGDADLLASYPMLRAEDLTNAWAYYCAHRDEIEHQIADNECA